MSEVGPKRARRRAGAGAKTNPREALFDAAKGHAPYIGVEVSGCRFVVATDDHGVDRGLFIKQARPEFRVLSRAAGAVALLAGDDAVAGRMFVDVGANIGTTTVHALATVGFGSAVSCEPEEHNYRLLRANVALNDLEDRVRPLQMAVSGRAGSAQFVVVEGRRGRSWLAVDGQKIREAQAVRARRIAENPGVLEDPNARQPAQLAEMTVVEVELVTIDGLVSSGVLDLDRIGMLWIDAEGHEGHILKGAGTVTEAGVPVVFEFDPKGLEQRGDREQVHAVAAESYTHFVDVRRQEGGGARFRLRQVAELRRYEANLLDPANPVRFTDLLLLRLDAQRAKAGDSLTERLVKRRAAGLGV